MTHYRSNGKLLLTAEYVVLDGAVALAVPTKYGQSLSVVPQIDGLITWKSYDENNKLWFHVEFEIDDIITNKAIHKYMNNPIAQRLLQILKEAFVLNPKFLRSDRGFSITTNQDFNRLWGLGTSSTLINNIANWAKVDAYNLLNKTFGGSGYDIACAQNNTPITYQLNEDKIPLISPVDFNPNFKDELYFVYLNQKQDSRAGIAAYKNNVKQSESLINEIAAITAQIILCTSRAEFDTLITAHEKLIANVINQEPVKSSLFPNFEGAIKSLGAWGGDFALATSSSDPSAYFANKGYRTVLPFNKMVL